jgi:formylglycine-generating enzyme required for sulfatase activity
LDGNRRYRDEAKTYARLESDNDPKYTYDLPTEAQQEVAFRGKTTTIFVSGDDAKGVDAFAWHEGNSEKKAHPVKSRVPNSFGVYRSGVWEWGLDWYDADYAGSDGLDPKGPAGPREKSKRVLRGGSWSLDVQRCRSAYRFCWGVNWSTFEHGVRLVRTSRNSQ